MYCRCAKTLVCCSSSCCVGPLGEGECTLHAARCGGGVAPFLLLRSCSVLLLLGKGRMCDWGSLYLDHHGEEDRDFKRGKVCGMILLCDGVRFIRLLSLLCLHRQTLFLSMPRVRQLRRLVQNNQFAHETKILRKTSRAGGIMY